MRPLLDRMLEFADDLNAEIVEALAPKLLVVPFSLVAARVPRSWSDRNFPSPFRGFPRMNPMRGEVLRAPCG